MIKLVAADQVSAQPWRNGGGRTRELLAWPSPADWQLRISVADIEADGPFSAFPGVQRWFAVIEGAGVLLDGKRVQPGDAPIAFDGAAAPGCRLIGGPTRDLNLMLIQGANGGMQTAIDGEAWTPRAARCGLFAAQAGTLRAGDARWTLPPRTLAWFDQAPAAALTFHADDPAGRTIGWWLSFTETDR